MNRSAEKGKKAERELCSLLHDLSGWKVRRALGNGRHADAGDLDGLPNCIAQIKNYADPLRAEREALAELEHQRQNAGTSFAVAFIRHRGNKWVAVMTPAQFLTLLREATQPMSHAEPKETSP